MDPKPQVDESDEPSDARYSEAVVPEPAGLPLLGNIRSIDPEFPLGSMKALADEHGTYRCELFCTAEDRADLSHRRDISATFPWKNDHCRVNPGFSQ